MVEVYLEGDSLQTPQYCQFNWYAPFMHQ